MKKTLLIIGIVLDIIISLIILFGCTPSQNQPLSETQTVTQTLTEEENKKFTFKVDRIIVNNVVENPTITPSDVEHVG